MTRTIIIGDIHGCYAELGSLLEKAHFGSDDRVVAVGDLIVKGPANRDVLDLFNEDPRFTSVIGNHDLAILNFWRGKTTVLNKSQHRTRIELESDRERYEKYLGSLPFIIDFETHAVVHAGIRPGVPLSKQAAGDLTELRTLGTDRTRRDGTPWFEVYDDEKIIVYGHWPSPRPRLVHRTIGLDTGCVYGNCLSAYIVETQELLSVPSQQTYQRASPRFLRQLQ